MFSEKDRLIYQCPVFQTFHDPLSVKRSLVIAGKGGFNRAAATYKSPDASESERALAEAVLVTAGRAAFSLPVVDAQTGKGVTDATVLDVVSHFTGWLLGKGEPAQNGPTSAPCTDCPGN